MSASRLPRCREELRAARVLLDAGLPSQALSRAYMAGYHAAAAALLPLGELPATPPGLVSAFGRQLVAERGFDHHVGRVLRRLFDDRADVDYGLAEAPPAMARTALADAERLVEEVERWLERAPYAPPAGITR